MPPVPRSRRIPDEVEALVTKEHLCRLRELANAGEATRQDEPQGELELDNDVNAEDVHP
jgi:hypothetical protein